MYLYLWCPVTVHGRLFKVSNDQTVCQSKNDFLLWALHVCLVRARSSYYWLTVSLTVPDNNQLKLWQLLDVQWVQSCMCTWLWCSWISAITSALYGEPVLLYVVMWLWHTMQEGWTPLIGASHHGCVNSVGLLLANQANVNSQTEVKILYESWTVQV